MIHAVELINSLLYFCLFKDVQLSWPYRLCGELIARSIKTGRHLNQTQQ